MPATSRVQNLSCAILGHCCSTRYDCILREKAPMKHHLRFSKSEVDVSYLVGAHDVSAFGSTLTVPVDVAKAVGSRAPKWRVEETMEAKSKVKAIK